MLVVALAAAVAAPAAPAQENGEGEAVREAESDWEIMLAAGLGVMPVYEGSADYGLVPVPYVYVNWRDFIILGPRGLTANLYRRGDFTAGAALTFSSGRDEQGNTFFGSGANEDLMGMGDIGVAAGAKLFGSYDFSGYTFGTSVTRYLGEENDGTLAEFELSRTFEFRKILRVSPSIELTFADSRYMDTFFSVTPEQSRLSQFAPYDAGAGFKDVSLGVNLFQMLSRNWFIFLSGKAKFLIGDAEDSPISRSNINGRLILSVGYRF